MNSINWMKYGLCHQQNHRTKIRMRLQKKNIENVWFNLRLTKPRILNIQMLNIKEKGKHTRMTHL